MAQTNIKKGKSSNQYCLKKGVLTYVPEGNDFYEARHEGWSFRSTERMQYSAWVQTNNAKKYWFSFNFFTGQRKQFVSRNYQINISNRYCFNDKLSVGHDLFVSPFSNDAGYYFNYYVKDANGADYIDANGQRVLENIIFPRRDRMTMENVVNVKYNFNNRSGLTFRVRHYWGKVEQKQFYDLQDDGTLKTTSHNDIAVQHRNFNLFNVDAVYTLQFAPGSFINIVWKDAS